MNKNKRKLLCVDLLIAALLLAFDQFTKHLALLHLKGKDAFVLIEGVLELDYLENRGAAFGMLQGQKFFLVAIGIVFMAVICWFVIRIPDNRKFLAVHILAAAIVAGGLGNMVDRIRLDYVVDFISFVLINYPIFNVADIYVVVSAIALFILILFVYKEEDMNFLDKKGK